MEYYFDSSGNQYTVNEGQFLLGSFEQHSGESMVNSDSYVDGICVYLKPALLGEIYSSLVSSHDEVLDNFPNLNLTYPGFFNHIYTSKFTPLDIHLKQIAGIYHREEYLMPENKFDEYLMEIGEKIVLLHFGIAASLNRLDFLKQNTKHEIMRRMLLAKDFIDENYLNNPTLDEISSFSMLSKFHLLRCFKLAFQQSPFEYLQDKRLEFARKKLQMRDTEITDIALQCSFLSLASFSKAFKKKFGVPPSYIQRLTQPTYSFIGS